MREYRDVLISQQRKVCIRARNRPDVIGIDYAVFSLGDSSYENYSKGSENIDTILGALGATRVGEYGRHDANTGTLPNDSAVAWVKRILSTF